MILFALADATRTGVHKAMIFQYLKVNNWSNYKIDYYGHTRSWSQSGSAISSLIAALFVFYSEDYNIIFLASIIPYFADMILIYSYPTYLDGEVHQISGKKILHKFAIVITAFTHSFRRFNFFRVLTNLSLYTGYYKAMKDYIQPLLVSVAVGSSFLAYLNKEKKIAIIVGLIYFILFLLTAVVSKNSGKFTTLFKHMNKPMNLTIVTGLLVGILTGLTFHLGLYILPIIGFIITMMIENLRKPIGIGFIANLSEDESMATTLSVTSQTKSIIAAIIAPLTGWVADIYNPGTGIAIVSLIIIFGLPLYWLKGKNADI